MADYFVTGGTGLLGRWLVPLLASRGSVRLLVRDSRITEHAALLERWAPLGVETVPGDVVDFDAPIDASHVVHLAALYDLTIEDEAPFERINVGGTRHLLQRLRGWEGTLHHVSSIAVAGDYRKTFRESMLDEGQKLGHPYHRSKLRSEALVRQSEVRHRIYRPGAVVGDSTTGEALRADGPYYLFGLVARLAEWLPRWAPLLLPKGAPLQMVPVDYVAAAIDHLMHREGLDGKTFHVVDPDPPSLRRTYNHVAAVASAPRAGKNWLGPLLGAGPMGQMLGQLGATRFFREELYRDFGVPPVVHELLNPDVRYDTTELRAGLEGSGIVCPDQADYVEPLYEYWKRHLDPRRDLEGRRRAALEGKVVLVTGASSGIGEAFARRAADYGATLVLVARREEELARVKADLEAQGGEASVFPCDLTDMAQCDAAVAHALEAHGRLDVLVNNAGHSIRRPLHESLARFHDLERLMTINYFAPARLIAAALPELRARQGVVVNVLSAGAHMPSPRFGAYTAAKSALSQLGRTLGAELWHEGVAVSSIMLPWVRTPMMDATGKYAETRAMTPDQAVDWMLEGLVDRVPFVMDNEMRRRYVLAILAPKSLGRILSVVDRIYADDPDAHPELALDRGVMKRFVKGRLI